MWLDEILQRLGSWLGWPSAGYTNLKTSMNSDPQYTCQSQAEPRTPVTPKLGRRREPEGSSQALGSGRDQSQKNIKRRVGRRRRLTLTSHLLMPMHRQAHLHTCAHI